MATSRIADSVGRVLGDRYRLLRPIGVGASAHVFSAEDVQLRRRVAVKVLHPALAGEEAFLRRFRRESQAVASLRHPNILRVYDWGEDHGSPFLVMELLEGGSLRSMLDRDALLSPAQAAAVGADVARALDYAHRQGIVHRDIKPANLIFDEEGRVSVADFGLARALAEATWTEPAGAVMGTARYASPELVRGEQLDSKADVYSLALVLIEAVTGQVPFVADTPFGTLMARVGRPLEVPDAVGPLQAVIEAAGAADPAVRTDARALARALDEVSARLPFPAPLSLAPPDPAELVERDDQDPTEFPGRPRLFDAEAANPDPDPDPRQPTGAKLFDGEEGVDGPRPDGRSKLFDGAQWEDPGAGPAGDRVSSTRPGAGPGLGLGPAVGGGTAPAWPDPVVVPARPRRRLRRVVLAVLLAVLLAAAGGSAWALTTGFFTPNETVPVLAGRTPADASAILGRLHLHLRVTAHAYSPTVGAGRVLTQASAPGTHLEQGRTVAVVVSDGPRPVPVPPLAGVPVAVAQQDLKNLGLTWTVNQASSMTVPAGSVISSTPGSGTLVPGQSVSLVVSTGKPQVTVPAVAVQTETYDQAAADLTKAGLVVARTDSYEDSIANGLVVSVTPPPGATVTIGSTVNLVVSKGPHYVAVPDVRGDSVGAASEKLGSLGFNVAGVQGNPVNTVTGTSPAGGTQALYGAQITIVTG